eukprot:5662272-Pyramimonas_sp.AAC.1
MMEHDKDDYVTRHCACGRGQQSGNDQQNEPATFAAANEDAYNDERDDDADNDGGDPHHVGGARCTIPARPKAGMGANLTTLTKAGPCRGSQGSTARQGPHEPPLGPLSTAVGA